MGLPRRLPPPTAPAPIRAWPTHSTPTCAPTYALGRIRADQCPSTQPAPPDDPSGVVVPLRRPAARPRRDGAERLGALVSLDSQTVSKRLALLPTQLDELWELIDNTGNDPELDRLLGSGSVHLEMWEWALVLTGPVSEPRRGGSSPGGAVEEGVCVPADPECPIGVGGDCDVTGPAQSAAL